MSANAGREDGKSICLITTGYHKFTGGNYWPHTTEITGREGVSTGSGAHDMRINLFELR
jgi:hypothetical protein